MVIQYFIVAIIVIVVIVWQYSSYRANEKRIERIKQLFPSSNTCVVVKDDDTTSIYNNNASGEFKETLNDINSYLMKNKNKTFDYHILKEIVDRNSKSLEDEVDTMLSVPLYLGLIATIFGIAFGVVVFAWKDLGHLLAGVNMDPEGIKVLLTDVGIAMAASLCGVFFTKQSTTHYNEARTIMSRNKNKFLTWIQTDLMSKLSDDITGALIKMTQDLNEFNSSFAQNTRELRETLSTVNESYEGQVKLLDAIDKIKISKIATANIEVYDRLQGCTKELEGLFTILAESEAYVSKVTELNTQLGSIEQRTQLFEELGNYFKNEVEFVKDRQGMMRQQMSGLDSVLQDALLNMGNSLTRSLQNLTAVFQAQNQRIQQLIEEQQHGMTDSLLQQQKAVNEKIGQINNPFDGLKEIFENGLRNIRESFDVQNNSIQELLAEQNKVFEDALRVQQEAVLEKLQKTPNQLEFLSDMAKSVDRLNHCVLEFEHNLQGQYVGLQNSSNSKISVVKKKRSFWSKFRDILVPICAIGSFLVLLGMLLLQIYR